MKARNFQPWSSPLNSRSARRGSVLPIIAISMVILLGAASLAVDYGVLLSDRNQLQRACDAAALAGASYLKRTGDDATNTSRATAQAKLIAKQNYLADSEMPDANITFTDNNTRIHVVATRTRSLFFARILGIKTGNVSANAVAGVGGLSTPQVVPIAITPTTKARYENDKLPHTFTLSRAQDTAFQTNYSGLTPYDPFQVFDLRQNQAKSPSKMAKQLSGEDKIPVELGDQVTDLAASLNAQGKNFEDGIGAAFTKAAGAPWFDPATGAASTAWQTVGTRLPDILSGTSPSDNPRIMSLVVVEETTAPVSNYNSTILDFAPVYVHSVTETAAGIQLTVTFLDPSSGATARPVSLLE